MTNGVIDLPSQVESLISKGAVETQIQETETKNREQEARLNYITSRLGISADEALDAEEIASDPVFASLRSRFNGP